MLPLPELTREKAFSDALEISRWEAYAAALTDLFMVAEGRLRGAASGREYDLVARLVGLYATTLSQHPVPAHRPEGWTGDIEATRQRLTTAQLAPPMAIADIAGSISISRLPSMTPLELQASTVAAGIRCVTACANACASKSS